MVKYIISETCIETTYINGSTYNELNEFLKNNNFEYISSHPFGDNLPDLSLKGLSEFDILYKNKLL